MAIVYVPDIECDSCVKLITKTLNKNGIAQFKIKDDYIVLDEVVKAEQVVKLIQDIGYRASQKPFERKTLKERMRHIKENKKAYELEHTGIKYGAGVLALLVGLFVITYVGYLTYIPNFLSNYGWWFFYLIISVVSIGIGVWHFYAYRTKFTCMVGMMIGMTFGMQTGFMLGAVIGATNGFFIGSMAGMLIGTAIGVITGKCCGVMGVMEGAMAGLMGGTMGPMISVMMFSDHLLWFMPFYMIINIGIMIGLSYMLYEEVVENNKNVVKKPIDFTTLASLSIIVTFLLGLLMIYGPKSALISF